MVFNVKWFFQNTDAEDCYIVDIYNTKDDIFTLLTGSYANEGYEFVFEVFYVLN